MSLFVGRYSSLAHPLAHSLGILTLSFLGSSSLTFALRLVVAWLLTVRRSLVIAARPSLDLTLIPLPRIVHDHYLKRPPANTLDLPHTSRLAYKPMPASCSYAHSPPFSVVIPLGPAAIFPSCPIGGS